MKSFNYKKAVQVLNFFAQKAGGSINYMKALKLIYLSDRLHLRYYGRPITSDQYYAMKFGPVPSATYDIAKDNYKDIDQNQSDYRYNYVQTNETDRFKLDSVGSLELEFFSKSDLNEMSNIFEEFGHMSQFQLSELTHIFPEWTMHEEELKTDGTLHVPMDYKNFFLDPDSSKNPRIFALQDEDILEVALESFHRYNFRRPEYA